MIAYTFYWTDETEEIHLIGVLLERRKNAERITQESIINFARKSLGNNAGVDNIFFIQVEIDGRTGEIYWSKPYVATYKSV
jgi:hypothetical protein